MRARQRLFPSSKRENGDGFYLVRSDLSFLVPNDEVASFIGTDRVLIASRLHISAQLQLLFDVDETEIRNLTGKVAVSVQFLAEGWERLWDAVMDTTLAAMLLIGGFATVIITIVILVENAKKKDAANQKSNLALRNNFSAEVIHGSSFGNLGIAIDGVGKKFAILNGNQPPRIFNFSQLVEVEVQRDGQSLMKANRGSQVAGAAVGAVLLGPAGLLLGGLTGSKSSVDTIRKLSLIIYTNDFSAPVYEIVFFQHFGASGTKVSDLTMQMNELKAWHGRLKAILAMNSQPSQLTA